MGNVRPNVFGLQDELAFPGRLSRSARLASGEYGRHKIWWFPTVAIIRPVCILHQPKRQCPRSYRLMALFSVAFSWMMPFHALSLCFRMKMIKPAIVTRKEAVKKVVIFDSTPFQQLWGNIFSLKSALLRQRARNLHGKTFPLAQIPNVHHILHHTALFHLCCHFSDSHV